MNPPDADAPTTSASSEVDSERLPTTPAQGDVEALQLEIEQLRHAMESRAAIEQAKGMLMLSYDLDESVALDLLARWSQEHNVKVRALAHGMTQSKEQPDAAGAAGAAGAALGRSMRQHLRGRDRS